MFPPEALTDVSERGPLGVGQPEPSGEMRAQDSVLRGQVFALEKQALVHQACDVCQEACPCVVAHDESTWYRPPVNGSGAYFGRTGMHEPFYFYDPYDASPKFSYDPTGMSTTGRYTVRFNTEWNQSVGPGRSDVDIELIEVA